MNNEYHRQYNNERYQLWRQKQIDKLGGKCVICSSTEELEFDHIDRETKEFDIGKGWALSQEIVDKELAKCQLLCNTHHTEKSVLERGQTLARGTHGTISSYRYCGPPKCEECKAAKREVMRKWRARRAKMV